MIVRVKAVMHLAMAIGKHLLDVELPDGSSINDLIENLSAQYGDEVSKILHDERRSDQHPGLMFIVNGNHVIYREYFDTVLQDEVDGYFVLPACGG